MAFQLLWKLGGILEFDTYIVSSDTQATNQGQVAKERKVMLIGNHSMCADLKGQIINSLSTARPHTTLKFGLYQSV